MKPFETKFASEEEKQKMRVQDLSFDFAKRIVFLCKPYNNSRNIDVAIYKQIFRSGTSIVQISAKANIHNQTLTI